MNIKKSLTSFFFLIFGFLALTVSSCAFTFALAITIRCLIRAWHAGWTLFAVLIIGCSVTLLPAAPLGTPVYFPQIGTTGAANSRDIMVIPDQSRVPLVYASNLVAFQTLLLHPTRGGTTNYLLPWGYTLRVDGTPVTSHIVVPISTNVINVVSLITNALAIGYPITFGGGGGPATNIDNATGTNVSVSIFTADNITLTIGTIRGKPPQYPISSPNSQGEAGTSVGLIAGNGGAGDSNGGNGGDVLIDAGQGALGGNADGAQGTIRIANNGEPTVIGGPVTAASYQGPVNYPSGAPMVDSGGNVLYLNGTSFFGLGGFLFYYNGSQLSDGNGNLWASSLHMPGIQTSNALLTNNGVVWFVFKTNGVPNVLAPNGSICTTTNGQFFVRSNSVWMLK